MNCNVFRASNKHTSEVCYKQSFRSFFFLILIFGVKSRSNCLIRLRESSMAAKRVYGLTIDMSELFLLDTAMRRSTLTIVPERFAGCHLRSKSSSLMISLGQEFSNLSVYIISIAFRTRGVNPSSLCCADIRSGKADESVPLHPGFQSWLQSQKDSILTARVAYILTRLHRFLRCSPELWFGF